MRYELSLEIQFLILVVFKILLDSGEFYTTLSYLKVCLKSGNTGGLVCMKNYSLPHSVVWFVL